MLNMDPRTLRPGGVASGGVPAVPDYAPTTAFDFVTAYNSAQTGEWIDISGGSGVWDVRVLDELVTDQFFRITGPGADVLAIWGRFTVFDGSGTGTMPAFNWSDFKIDVTGLGAVTSIYSLAPICWQVRHN